MRLAIVYALAVFGCAETSEPISQLSDLDQSVTACGSGPTVKGMDVSYYQGTIDWATVKSDGVQFAIIRVSDGLNTPDTKFDSYWADSRAAGVLHGAYQFFEPSQDPIAQADMLLAKTGTLKPDDLPPTIDVEVTGGLAAAQVAAKVKLWIDHVKAATGRDPIVYTGMYFWRDSVGGANVLPSPLFHAQYTSATCPDIAAPWTTWTFWQYTSTGTVNGISGGVDVDRFNGTMAELQGLLGGGGSGTCGNGTCDAGESTTSCPQDCPCGTIDATGGTIDDGDACFVEGGPINFMRQVSTAGNNGTLIWTHTTSNATEANYGQWNLFFAAAGHYRVEVYTAAAFAQSKQAKYLIHGAADTTATIDQTATDGWQTLGDYDFAASGQQWIHLGDNTGEPGAGNIQLVFDAVRLTPLDGGGAGSGSDSGSGSGSETGGGGSTMGGDRSGCNAGGGSGFGIVVALGGLLRRRRRINPSCFRADSSPN
jgi:GH25 family lysozyme M1 (1,4-beta-N-acetylmuramidase)